MEKCVLYEPGVRLTDLLSARDVEPPLRVNSMDVIYKWKPRKILILTSPFDSSNIKNAVADLVSFINNLLETKVIVYDRLLVDSTLWFGDEGDVPQSYFGCDVLAKCKTANEDRIHEELDLTDTDLVLTLGGDGTLLIVNKIFSDEIPPVIGLSMGSLGYLAKFNINRVKDTLRSIETIGFKISLRSQLFVSIYDEDGNCIIERNALNECVIDRGLSPYITTLDVYYNGNYFTTVSGDGLLIGTPSGSTAYSMSAGGPIVHPDVPSMLFTVICPHSISYRPLVLPCSAVIEVLVPPDNRGNARVCIDGNYSCDIKHGSTVKITTSKTLFPLVLPKDTQTTTEWCKTLKEHLHWNVRIRQNKLHLPLNTRHA